MKMSACWMFAMILMGCRSSHATESTCACKDEPRPVCVPAGADVPVPCPELTADEMKVSLFQGEEVIYNHSCSRADSCVSSNTRLDVELHKNNKSASFRLTDVNASSYGIYRCEGTVTFPPPIKTVRSERILVLVEGHQCKKTCSNFTTAADPNHGFHWIWACGLTSMYSIIATIVAIVFWVKLRRTDSQSDYMNTKPRATRDPVYYINTDSSIVQQRPGAYQYSSTDQSETDSNMGASSCDAGSKKAGMLCKT